MSNEHNAIIGYNIRFYRSTRDISLQKLSTMLAEPISGQQLAKYETGQSRWPADLVCEIADILEVDINTILGVSHNNDESAIGTAQWDAEKVKALFLRMPEKKRKISISVVEAINNF